MANFVRLFFLLLTSATFIYSQVDSKDISQMPDEFNNPSAVTTPGDAVNGTLSESFEDPTFPPAGWTKLNPDLGTGWTRLTAGTTPFPGWNGGTVTVPPGGGNAVAFATYTTGGATYNDQWLVTPQITNVQTGDQLSFWMWFPFSSYADSVDLLISTTGISPSDFNVVVEQYYLPVGSVDTSWTQYTYTLSDYVSAGSDIYIAWREHVSDNFNDGAIVCVDLVEVTEAGGTITIAEAIEDLDGDFVPDRLGQTVTVEGVVFSPNFQTTNNSFYIHDGTAGTDIFMFGPPVFTWASGDMLQITGEVDQFNGMTEIIPADTSGWVFMSAGNPTPNPILLTLAQYKANPEMYEGSLVGFMSLTLVGGTWPTGGSTNLDFSDGVDTMVFRIDSDTDIPGQPEPTWPRDILGIGSQYDSSPPYDGGYQIFPRYYATDFLPPGTIPVELSAFSANVSDGIVTLIWSTSTETNNLGFEVQRTFDGNFRTIAFVEGYGTTTESHDYYYTDNTVEAGSYSYRLKQVDYNGNFEYSEAIHVEVVAPVAYSLEQNYPNPFNPSTKIVFNLASDSKITLTIFNVLGEKVMELANGNFAAGKNKLDFDASGLNSGVYFYRIDAVGVDGTNFSSARKMILTK